MVGSHSSIAGVFGRVVGERPNIRFTAYDGSSLARWTPTLSSISASRPQCSTWPPHHQTSASPALSSAER